jgi:sulfate/thiosulfate transport system permease protein
MARTRHVLPGFRLTLGFSIAYLSVIVLIPFAALAWKASQGGLGVFFSTLNDPRVLASLKLSFGASLIAALVCGVLGVLTAWALERYRFPGKHIVDAMVDLPFALPTAVAGIALCTLYAPRGWMGSWLAEFGIKAAYSQIGIVLALIFIGFPFVVRTVQPIIQGLHLEVEEAAACLGANRWQTFWRVIFPSILPGTLAGMTLAFGRAVGEYGSVVFISGNMPFKTEIAPLVIVTRLEQHDYTGAAALGLILLIISFAILLLSNVLQSWNHRRIVR